MLETPRLTFFESRSISWAGFRSVLCAVVLGHDSNGFGTFDSDPTITAQGQAGDTSRGYGKQDRNSDAENNKTVARSSSELSQVARQLIGITMPPSVSLLLP